MTILVTGATGNVGRHLVRQLADAGHKVRALTRDASKARLPEGVEVVTGDLTDIAGLAPAFDGVEAVHLINFGGNDYGLLDNGAELVELAVKSGVKRVTMLTGWERGSLDAAVEASPLAWTRLMPGEFMSNTLEWAEPIIRDGRIEQPFGGGYSPLTHEADLASVALVALTTDGHGGQTYKVNGAEVLTKYERLRILGEATGRELEFVDLTPAEATERWKAAHLPDETIAFLLRVFGDLPTDPYPLESDVERVTGKPPRRFAQWAAEHAPRFRA
ncbi:MAG TPA: NAD(P)H-binding protein [Stackebrandtia sp.]|jgi:uncharacterized protein YbjT (DUF2867 family)|uniref:NAD(P)H-binding protein n=1 Tax=Stackebrandtia sp. TaxID=2023065 RepID=UPI002D4A04A0|nr:NAD(P)H-binding protein [Stackebrandtia sp.]HZE38855.1 NAD(P)H-binding protein [Stackebrandtia sp.]